MKDGSARCPWATGDLLTAYHDTEWGVPNHDDRHHFEFLVLESAQSGLSWSTVLAKRDGYRRLFAAFDPAAVAEFSPADVDRLLGDPGIIRNRAKIESAIANAKAFLEVQSEWGTFDAYLWSFTDGAVLTNRWTTPAEIPARTELSIRLATDLRSRGFRFLGPIVCYSHLQASGVVNDHLVSCPRWRVPGS